MTVIRLSYGNILSKHVLLTVKTDLPSSYYYGVTPRPKRRRDVRRKFSNSHNVAAQDDTHEGM